MAGDPLHGVKFAHNRTSRVDSAIQDIATMAIYK